MSERTPAQFTLAEFIEGTKDGSFAPDKGDALLWLCTMNGHLITPLWLWCGGTVVDAIPDFALSCPARVHWYAKEPCA